MRKQIGLKLALQGSCTMAPPGHLLTLVTGSFLEFEIPPMALPGTCRPPRAPRCPMQLRPMACATPGPK